MAARKATLQVSAIQPSDSHIVRTNNGFLHKLIGHDVEMLVSFILAALSPNAHYCHRISCILRCRPWPAKFTNQDESLQQSNKPGKGLTERHYPHGCL